MHAVEQRLLEIVGTLLKRQLTILEATELRESHRYIEDREWKMARVLNLMKLARQTKDVEWLDQLAKEYHKVLSLY